MTQNDFRPLSFWSFNGDMAAEEIQTQIRQMKEQGYGGFYMHARAGMTLEYLGDAWFSACRVAVKEAKAGSAAERYLRNFETEDYYCGNFIESMNDYIGAKTDGTEMKAYHIESMVRHGFYLAQQIYDDKMGAEEKEEAAPIEQVIEAALTHGGPVIAVGECADKYKDKLISAGIKLAPPHSRLARAGSVAMAGLKKIREGKTDSPLSILPNYIRRSEAEVLWEKQHRKS